MKIPEALNAITDLVLKYKPKPKSDAAEKREKKKKQITRKRARESKI
jgi:hypothetical protein